MNLSGHTKPYAVLGHPIGHTLSPVMHNAAFAALGWDAVYAAYNVDPQRLMTVLEAMRDMGFVGANLTIPLKEVAFEGLAALDDSARLLGAVNTVKFSEHEIRGFNTDGIGFLRAVEESFGTTMKGEKLFFVGCGGAGRALALVAAGSGAASIGLSDADSERVERVASEIARQFPSVEVTVVPCDGEQAKAVHRYDLVVQATPAGMKQNDPSPLGPEAFHDGHRVFDLIYMYPETSVMKVAAGQGARCANGLGMLLHQGVKAFEVWTDTTPPVDVMRAVLEEAVYKA